MKTDQIICCVVALILGMLLANMLKNVCGCKVVEGQAAHHCGSSGRPTAQMPDAGCFGQDGDWVWCKGENECPDINDLPFRHPDHVASGK
jgi:hypothetical protein